MDDPRIKEAARRRALQRMQMALSARAAGADDDGAASDEMRRYTDSIDFGSGSAVDDLAKVADKRPRKRSY